MIRRIVGAAFEYAGNALCSLQDIKDALNTGIIKKIFLLFCKRIMLKRNTV